MNRFEYDRDRAMKQTDFSPCVHCGKGVVHTGVPLFYRVTIERMGIDARAVARQTGLEMMLGGHAKIANIMGPNDDIGLPIGPANEGLLCEQCAHDYEICFAEIADAMYERNSASKPEKSDADHPDRR
jgi:hypothetical protein